MTATAVRSLVKRSRSSRTGSSTPPETATPMTTPSATPTPLATPSMFDNFTVGAIRRHIHSKFAAKQVFTIETLCEDLKDADIIARETKETAVWRLIHQMGFRYRRTSQKNTYVRKETIDVVSRRINALRTLKTHREEGRQVVYVDETWFTTRMHHSREWVDTSQPTTTAAYSRHVPPGEGERFVVVAAGTDKGFIDQSFLCFPAKNKSGDYHGEMNGVLFIRWLTSQLLPALEEPSLLVLDNAPYHSQLTEESRCPNTATTKAGIITWLERRRIPFPPHATRPELLVICKENRPEPRHMVDDVINSWGHDVVRLPPAHPELNAIEQVWGCMKRYVRSSLQRFTRADLQARIQEAKVIANAEVWAGAIRRSRAFEEEYIVSDNIHESVHPVIITFDSDDDDDICLNSDVD